MSQRLTLSASFDVNSGDPAAPRNYFRLGDSITRELSAPQNREAQAAPPRGAAAEAPDAATGEQKHGVFRSREPWGACPIVFHSSDLEYSFQVALVAVPAGTFEILASGDGHAVSMFCLKMSFPTERAFRAVWASWRTRARTTGNQDRKLMTLLSKSTGLRFCGSLCSLGLNLAMTTQRCESTPMTNLL